jgi:hypothetical protein
MLVLSMLFILMGVAASIQSDRREELQNRLDSDCKVLAQGKDFIANTNGCHIKPSTKAILRTARIQL